MENIDNKFLNDLVEFAKNDKQLSSLNPDVLGKDLRFVSAYKNAKERGENIILKRDYNGFIRMSFIPKKDEFKYLEDFKNNRQLYQKFCQSLENIINFDDFNLYSDGHKELKKLFINYIKFLKTKKNKNTKELYGIYIYGNSKLGKTTICKTFIHTLKKMEINAEILKAQLITDLFLSNNKDIIQEFKNKKVLVIDDIGQGILSDYYIAQLTEILDYRFENNLLTIFNSNYSKNRLHEEFSKRTSSEVAQRLYSRINSLGNAEFEFKKEGE